MRTRIALLAGLCLALTSTAFGQGRNQLRVGAPAPGLDIERWVHGDETAIESGQVYIISFWESQSGPSKESFALLGEIQHEYQDDLTVIAISVDDNPSGVGPFVQSLSGKINFRVATDRRKSTQRAWMDAASVERVPVAFAVDAEGRIAWIGNPHPQAEGKDLKELIGKVVSGRYNPQLQRSAEPTIRAARSARKMRNWRMAQRHYDEVIAVDSKVFAEIALERFEMLLLDMKQKEEAYAYAQLELMGIHFADDAEALQWLALRIALDSKMTDADRDMDTALDAAEQARELIGRNDPDAMAVVAQIHFHRGELQEAINLQKRAYFIAEPQEKEAFERVLQTYQRNAQRSSSSVIRR